MKLLFIDFETQGDDPKTTRPTEVGALLIERGEPTGYVTEKTGLRDYHFRIIRRFQELIYDPATYTPQTQEIIDITGITDDMLKAEGKAPAVVFPTLGQLIEQADYVLAHNREFDQGVYEATCLRLALTPAKPKQRWICTWKDVPYAKKYRCKRLSHLAYDHGVIVPPEELHRAINDVELLARLITTKYDLDEIIKYANTPELYLRAMVPPPWEDGGAGRDQAKKHGFRWQDPGDGRVFEKFWVKKIRETELPELKAIVPFRMMKLIIQSQGVLSSGIDPGPPAIRELAKPRHPMPPGDLPV